MDDRHDLVVIGLGYVGLPLVIEASRAGLQVAGLDLDGPRVAALNAGRSHVDDVADAEVAEAVRSGMRATTDPSVLSSAATIVICVPTPLDPDHTPDLSAVRGAAHSISEHLKAGTLVVLESTTYPGTTQDVLRPMLEQGSGLTAGRDFHLAFSPERIDPGNEVWTLRNTPRVVGGLTPACTDAAEAFYGKICDRVVRTRGVREAEMAKLLENTYRHVNIALVNEMAVFCDELGIDLWDVIAAASTKPFGFQPFYPGPGVGGHCIPIDPNYLSYTVRTLGYPFRFVELAQEINNRMPGYVAARVQAQLNDDRLSVNGSQILLLGVTYKPDIADERESPAIPLAKRLLEQGAKIAYHDPYVPHWRITNGSLTCEADPVAAAADADLTVVLQHHRAYDFHAIVRAAARVFDARGVLEGQHVQRL